MSGLRRLSLSPFRAPPPASSSPAEAAEAPAPTAPASPPLPVAADAAFTPGDSPPAALEATTAEPRRRRRMRTKRSLDAASAAPPPPPASPPQHADAEEEDAAPVACVQAADALADALAGVSLALPAAPQRSAVTAAGEGPVARTAVAKPAARAASSDDDDDDDESSSSSDAESSQSESESSSSDDDASDSASSPAPRRVAPPAVAAPAPRRAAPSASSSRRAAKGALVAVSDDDEEQAKTAPRIEYTDVASGARCAGLAKPRACASGGIRAFAARMRSRATPPPRRSFILSSRLSARLFPHQREGVAWMWGRHAAGRGGILGDDMVRRVAHTNSHHRCILLHAMRCFDGSPLACAWFVATTGPRQDVPGGLLLVRPAPWRRRHARAGGGAHNAAGAVAEVRGVE
jgi:hypothetical protein